MSKTAFSILIAFLVCVPGMAQTTPEQNAVRITTDLVQIDAVVIRKGTPVKDLKQEDFEIFQDGRRQTLTSFNYVSSARDSTPATVALVVDDYGLSAQSMEDVKLKLRKFVDDQLKPNHLLAIVLTSAADKGVLPEFTNDKRVLDREWDQLVWNRCSRVGRSSNPSLNGSPVAACGADVAKSDSSLNAVRSIVEAMSKFPGRKSLVVFSDNLPLVEPRQIVGDVANLQKLSEIAVRASLVMYAIDPGSFKVSSLAEPIEYSNVDTRRADEYKTMLYIRSRSIEGRRKSARLMVEQTGGFLSKNQNNFQLDDILADQKDYYLIGYRPTPGTFDRRFHKLEIRVKKSGHTVRTRSGFFGMSEEDAKRLKD